MTSSAKPGARFHNSRLIPGFRCAQPGLQGWLQSYLPIWLIPNKLRPQQSAQGRALPMMKSICLALAGIAVVAATRPVGAQPYPSRPVTIITPFAAGSVTDATARAIAQHLQEALGQSFVVENRAGAGGLLAANAVARAAPDGHTLLITTNSTHSAAPGLFTSVPYDPIKDFTPVARIGSFPSLIAVHPGQPIHSMQEFVSYAKANPGKLSYAHGNSTGHITGEALKRRTGIYVVRVAYRSNPA